MPISSRHVLDQCQLKTSCSSYLDGTCSSFPLTVIWRSCCFLWVTRKLFAKKKRREWRKEQKIGFVCQPTASQGLVSPSNWSYSFSGRGQSCSVQRGFPEGKISYKMCKHARKRQTPGKHQTCFILKEATKWIGSVGKLNRLWTSWCFRIHFLLRPSHVHLCFTCTPCACSQWGASIRSLLTTRVWQKDGVRRHHLYVIRACNFHYPYKYFTVHFKYFAIHLPQCTTKVCSIFTWHSLRWWSEPQGNC